MYTPQTEVIWKPRPGMKVGHKAVVVTSRKSGSKTKITVTAGVHRGREFIVNNDTLKPWRG